MSLWLQSIVSIRNSSTSIFLGNDIFQQDQDAIDSSLANPVKKTHFVSAREACNDFKERKSGNCFIPGLDDYFFEIDDAISLFTLTQKQNKGGQQPYLKNSRTTLLRKVQIQTLFVNTCSWKLLLRSSLIRRQKNNKFLKQQSLGKATEFGMMRRSFLSPAARWCHFLWTAKERSSQFIKVRWIASRKTTIYSKREKEEEGVGHDLELRRHFCDARSGLGELHAWRTTGSRYRSIGDISCHKQPFLNCR
jgi:hypothetical protein